MASLSTSIAGGRATRPDGRQLLRRFRAADDGLAILEFALILPILLTLYSGHTPQQILATDALALFDELGFREHLTPQRSNGLRSMVERIRSDAREALATAS